MRSILPISAKTSQVHDWLSVVPSWSTGMTVWQIAQQIVCCEGYKTVGGISYEPTRHATPDHIWIKCWGWMFYSRQMVKWRSGGVSWGLEWPLPPRPRHLGTVIRETDWRLVATCGGRGGTGIRKPQHNPQTWLVTDQHKVAQFWQ